LQNLKSQLTVSCPVCLGKFKLENIDNHYKNDCNIMWKCKQGDCTARDIQGLDKLAKHFRECEYTKFTCQECEIDFAGQAALEEHSCIKALKELVKKLRTDVDHFKQLAG